MLVVLEDRLPFILTKRDVIERPPRCTRREEERDQWLHDNGIHITYSIVTCLDKDLA